MNAETTELLRRLEQATSATPVDCRTLDEETAMLRENWLALGKLLRASASQLEQPDRIELIQLRPAETSPAGTSPAGAGPTVASLSATSLSATSLAATSLSATSLGRSWRLALGCVASALTVVGLWLVFETTRSQNGAQPLANRPKSDADVRPGVLRSEAPASATAAVIELAWEDNWDNDLAQTTFAVRQFHGEQRARDSSLSRLQGEFQELLRDFESGSL